MKKSLLMMTAIAATASMAFAANPVTVGPAGDFATVSAAIASYTSTGANSGETAPLVINIDPAGTYDEEINIDDSATGVGDIVGDLVIQSATPGTLVPIALRDTDANGDAILLHQSVYGVTFKDLLLYPSTTDGATDEIIKIDKNTSANDATPVLHKVIGCVITEIDASGNPLITDKLSAVSAPDATINTARTGSFASMIQVWGDGSEDISLEIDDSALYGPTGTHLRLVGLGASQTFSMNNSVVSGSSNHCVRAGSGSVAWPMTITGDDQTAGPDTASVIAYPKNDTHAFWCSGSTAGTSLSIDGAIFYAPADGGSGVNRGISGTGTVDLTVANAIIASAGPNVVDGPNNAATFDNVTFHALGAGTNAFYLVAGTGSLTIADCIFSGPGTKLAGAATPDGGINVDYSAFVAAGPDAATAADDGVVTVTYGTNIITDDPAYASYDVTSPDFMDVTAAAYAAAGTGGAALAGGADYVSAVHEWLMY